MSIKKTTTLQRIKQYIDLKGINNKRFEESVGFSNGAFASQLKNNKTIGVDRLENILSVYPDINVDWLLTGNGEMLKNSDKSVNQISYYEKQDSSHGKIDYMTKYLETLEKLTKTQEMLVKVQNEKLELLKEIENLKDQGGDIVVGA